MPISEGPLAGASEVVEREPQPGRRVPIPERLLVAAAVELEHVRDAGRGKLAVQLDVLVAEPVVLLPDVEAEERRPAS